MSKVQESFEKWYRSINTGNFDSGSALRKALSEGYTYSDMAIEFAYEAYKAGYAQSTTDKINFDDNIAQGAWGGGVDE